MHKDHGKFCWYELMTDDVAAAERFYGAVLGWTTRDAGMPGQPYTLASAGDRQVAGLMATPPQAGGMPPAWLAYVFAGDIEATARAVKEKGGTIHRPPQDIPGVGRFAVAADPHDAVFCLFTSDDTAPEPPPMMAAGHVGWHELMAGDLDEAWAFYSPLFGWTKNTAVDVPGGGVYQLFAVGDGEAVGGMMTKPAEMQAPPAWGLYFTLDGLDAAGRRVSEGGGRILMGPMEVPGGAWILNCVDPQGAHFSLVSMAR